MGGDGGESREGQEDDDEGQCLNSGQDELDSNLHWASTPQVHEADGAAGDTSRSAGCAGSNLPQRHQVRRGSTSRRTSRGPFLADDQQQAMGESKGRHTLLALIVPAQTDMMGTLGGILGE